MTKTIAFLFFVLLFISCAKEAKASFSIEDLNDQGEENISFEVNASMYGFSPKQEQKILKAAELIKKVVKSTEFKDRILNYTYQGKKAFFDNKGLSNQQIYKKILEASEKMIRLGKNNTMDIELELYTDNDSITIGYTYPNVVRIFMNSKYFNKFKPHQVADNMMHEWLHKIGFDHSVEVTPDRRHSVPYAIGYIVKALALQYQ